jgi:hypothetical protein
MIPGTWYILRHKPTGGFMPEVGGSYTASKPSHYPKSPRMFHDERAAKIALSWWLKGRTTVTYYAAEDSEGEWRTKPDPTRQREEWEVVAVGLIDEYEIVENPNLENDYKEYQHHVSA